MNELDSSAAITRWVGPSSVSVSAEIWCQSAEKPKSRLLCSQRLMARLGRVFGASVRVGRRNLAAADQTLCDSVFSGCCALRCVCNSFGKCYRNGHTFSLAIDGIDQMPSIRTSFRQPTETSGGRFFPPQVNSFQVKVNVATGLKDKCLAIHGIINFSATGQPEERAFGGWRGGSAGLFTSAELGI
jgi:hypothetical protein